MTKTLPLSVAIPTLCREQVLLETLAMVLAQRPAAQEVLVVDQSPVHDQGTVEMLTRWDRDGLIRWIKLTRASQPGALNVALQAATQEFVLFLDDDIRIEAGFLAAHMAGFRSADIWAVAGQVLQPGEAEDPSYQYRRQSHPLSDHDFCFRSGRQALIENGMSGNLCVRRERAIGLGGFDENFLPPVAFRFDTDFCKRLCRAGGQILFEPSARIYHLRAQTGGTRVNSNHLTSASPEHGVGDYYFALRNSKGVERWKYILRRPFREVRTRFHLRHPWWIPVKVLGEVRAILLALRLNRQGPTLIDVEMGRSAIS